MRDALLTTTTAPPGSPAPDALLNTTDAAKRLGISKSALDQARLKGTGPKFVRIGKVVRYYVADIVAFLEEARHGRVPPLNPRSDKRNAA